MPKAVQALYPSFEQIHKVQLVLGRFGNVALHGIDAAKHMGSTSTI